VGVKDLIVIATGDAVLILPRGSSQNVKQLVDELKKREHPKRIMSMGGVDVYAGTQETPNSQLSSMEYADGTRVQLEVRGLYTNAEDKITMGLLVYGSDGWMHLGFDEWATYFGRKNEPGEHCSEEDANARSDEFQKFGNDGPIHYANFIDAVYASCREATMDSCAHRRATTPEISNCS